MPWARVGAFRKIPRLYFIHPHCNDSDPNTTHEFMSRIAHKHVIFLARDPRRVVFTYFFRLRKRIKDPQVSSMSLGEFIRHPDYGIIRIIDFLNSWYLAENRFKRFLFLRYEGVWQQPEKEIARLLEFLNVPVNLDVLRGVLAETEDITTCAIEDDSASLSEADLEFMERASLGLEPGLGYSVLSPGVE